MRITRGFLHGIPGIAVFWGAVFGLVLFFVARSQSQDENPSYDRSIESDWTSQENRLGREPTDEKSIREAVARGQRLIGDLLSMKNPPDLTSAIEEFQNVKKQVDSIDSLSEEQRLQLYRGVRWAVRKIGLKNPLIDSSPIVFMKRKRFICQMLHEYLGYYYDYKDIAGGGVFILEKPGQSMNARDLIGDRLPKGNFTTLSLSYGAHTVYFAFSERAEQKPDFYSNDRNSFHIYAMNADGSNLRQLTEGVEDDFNPCPLPDGGIAFMSTRRGGFGRCHNPWEPLPTYSLHRMNPDGGDIRTLSYHETNEWHPSVLHDGRIVYTRWDYVDRSAANFHGLWTSNPDGSNPMSLFGNYTMKINACYQPTAVPGSKRILFVAGAHHAAVGGSLVLFDPDRAALDPQTGEDDFSSLEFLTPEVCFPEAPGWPSSYFHSPCPLSENYYLVSFSFDPLPGMGPNVDEDTTTGLYLMDRFGNMELLYREEGISSMYPIPLRSRDVPPILPSVLDPKLGEQGEFMLTNVYQGHFPIPKDRPIRALRIFQILPKSETHVANRPRLGYANAESARMLLGTVPVEEDGSAYFRVPARVPLAFQAVDESGRAVQGMRSITYLQPGERRGCVGCHEPVGRAAEPVRPTAFVREPSSLQPGPDGSMPWNYTRLVQPILNRRCVQCHDGKGPSQDRPALTGESGDLFTVSYESLRSFVRYYEWGENSISQITTRPNEMPAGVSPLFKIIDGSHKDKVNLNDEERRNLYLWLDGNAAFYGCYSPAEQLAQMKGEAIPPPKLQ